VILKVTFDLQVNTPAMCFMSVL